MKKKIIYVDDELLNLELFRLQFEEHYDITLCSNPVEALDIIIDEEIPLIISDYKMPELNGMELISKIKNKRPEFVCILLTAFLQNSVEIESELLFEFVSKPYNKSGLMDTIEKGIEHFNDQSFRKVS